MLTLDLSLQPFGASAEPAPALKDCTKCRHTLPLEAFSPKKLGRLGRQSQCKACRATARVARYQDPTVREAQREYMRQRRTDPAVRGAERDYMRGHNRQRRQDPEYRKAEREYKRQRRTDPATRDGFLAQVRQRSQLRRARKAQATVETFTEAELFAAWDEAGLYACHWCDADLAGGFHVDHVVPLAGGGAHTIANLAPACADCNLSKGAKDPYAFAVERHPWLTDRDPDTLLPLSAETTS